LEVLARWLRSLLVSSARPNEGVSTTANVSGSSPSVRALIRRVASRVAGARAVSVTSSGHASAKSALSQLPDIELIDSILARRGRTTTAVNISWSGGSVDIDRPGSGVATSAISGRMGPHCNRTRPSPATTTNHGGPRANGFNEDPGGSGVFALVVHPIRRNETNMSDDLRVDRWRAAIIVTPRVWIASGSVSCAADQPMAARGITSDGVCVGSTLGRRARSSRSAIRGS
jgi:hypothetical protein